MVLRLAAYGLLATTAIAAGPVGATTLVSGPAGWNTDNVDVSAADDGEGTFFSVVYDRDPSLPGATTNGRIAYTPPEGDAPGIKVMNGSDQGSTPEFPDQPLNSSNCIMASSDAYCDGPMQTGKRFKQQLTAPGPMDLVFNVDASSTDETEYRVFQRLVNLTGKPLAGFDLQLGFGIGSGFVASTDGDGLSLTPRDQQLPTQFPFGLFGEADNPDGRLGGFFDATARAGFNTEFTEDSISTEGLFGAYSSYFGPGWVTQQEAPKGLLWDDDGDDTTDAVVMAFLDKETGMWEQRRFINTTGPSDPFADTLIADPAVRGPMFANIEDIDLFDDDTGGANWDLDGDTFFEDAIEDIANLNVNWFLQLGDATGWRTYNAGDGTATFTMRVTTTVVPAPVALPMMVLTIAGLAGLRMRRAAKAA